MATHKSDLIAAKDAFSVSDKSAFSSERTNATVLHATAVYTFKGTETSGDFIEVAELPAGAIVIPNQSFVADSNPSALTGRSIDVKLGIPGNTACFGYVPYLQVATARNFSGSVLHDPVPLATKTRVVANLSAINGSAIPSGKKIAFGISYAIKG
jgi:hypothetical protein